VDFIDGRRANVSFIHDRRSGCEKPFGKPHSSPDIERKP